MPDSTLLAEAMATLYAGSPEEFISSRTALVATAKAAGDAPAAKEIGALRRPSVAAWALNVVAREADDAVTALLDVGAQLRDAQSRLDAASIQGLRKERDAAVDGYVSAAVRCAAEEGRSLSPSAQQEVRDTAIAALADAAAADAVRSGQLVKSLSYSGFGEVDVSDAVARTSSGSILSVLPGGASDEPAAKAPASKASGSKEPAADARAARVAKAAAAKEDAARERAARAEEVASAERGLAAAEEQVEQAEELLTDARRAHREALRLRDAAEDTLRRARAQR